MSTSYQGPAAPLSAAGFADAAATLSVDAATVWAVVAVETRGFGFQADRRPLILFERHVFHRQTHGAHSKAHPDISNPQAGGYGLSSSQYGRLLRAEKLDPVAALESASWGLPQIMGFNAGKAGFVGVKAMIAAFLQAEDHHLRAMADFIVRTPAMHLALQQKNWRRFAFLYNGPAYEKNNYHSNLHRFYEYYLVRLPDVELRADQARLRYCGYNPKGIDGFGGGKTAAALEAFQRAEALPATGERDDATRARLKQRAGV